MKQPVEIIQGDKSLRLTLYIIVTSYLLLIISIEPAIDYVLLVFIEQNNSADIEQINQLKVILSVFLYSILAFIPASFASWFGYRIVASSKLPPVLLSGKTRFPFTVVVLKGKPAKMFGVLIIVVSLALIVQISIHFIKVLFL